jgi:plastocyanin
MSDDRPLTTRRGFIAATSLGIVSLYGLWVGFGAAPLPWASRDHAKSAHEPPGGGHAGHGAGSSGPSVEEFREATRDFVERYGLPDGSVQPARAKPPDGNLHSGHGAAHGHAGMPAAPAEVIPAEAIDVYLMAYQWGFEPAVLRLDTGTAYRFRMMAVDANHGASLQMGDASRIIRLRRGALVEQALTFTAPGEYLVYCTVYCGVAHERMLGRLIVT